MDACEHGAMLRGGMATAQQAFRSPAWAVIPAFRYVDPAGCVGRWPAVGLPEEEKDGNYRLGHQGSALRQLQLRLRLSLPVQCPAEGRLMPGGRRLEDRGRSLRRRAIG